MSDDTRRAQIAARLQEWIASIPPHDFFELQLLKDVAAELARADAEVGRLTRELDNLKTQGVVQTTIDGECIQQLEAEVLRLTRVQEVLSKLLRESKRQHVMHACGLRYQWDGAKCDCGSDAWNAKVDAALTAPSEAASSMSECYGCLNIKNGTFPFGTNKKGQPAIDTEGCGHYDREQYSWLAINFCPVCGRRLEASSSPQGKI